LSHFYINTIIVFLLTVLSNDGTTSADTAMLILAISWSLFLYVSMANKMK